MSKVKGIDEEVTLVMQLDRNLEFKLLSLLAIQRL